MITIGFSTRKDNQPFIDYLQKTSMYKKVEIIQKINNNEKSLTQIYNEIINEAKHNIIVLVHDDIEFDTKNWGDKILNIFNKNPEYGIIGVAGTTDINNSGVWWEDRTKMVGIVNHKTDNKKWTSKYANGVKNLLLDVCFIDGLFIAINKPKIKNLFNENIPGFHFYDMIFCTENYLNNVKIGVSYDIRLTHKSIGITNSSWEENKELYINLFKDKLPIKLKPKIDFNSLVRHKETKNKFKLIVQTTNKKENIVNFLNNLNKLTIYKNLEIYLISTDSNFEYINQFKSNNIIIYEGFFETLNKNLSILKWDETFLNKKDELLFFAKDNILILNDIFNNINLIYKKEKHNFGCVFPSVLDSNDTIFSNGIEIIQNNEQNLNLLFKHNSTYYNMLNGYNISYFGSLGDFFATSFKNLENNDWFNINLETSVYNLDFALKNIINKRKVFIDTNSIIKLDINSEFNKLDEELKQILGKYLNEPEIKKNIKRIK